jgi:hypothetical protein
MDICFNLIFFLKKKNIYICTYNTCVCVCVCACVHVSHLSHSLGPRIKWQRFHILMDAFRTNCSCLPYANGRNSPVQSRNTPVTMTTPHTTSLHTENTFCIRTYSFTLMKLMEVNRPVEYKLQGLIKISSSDILK